MQTQELKAIADALRKAANALFSGPCRDVRDGEPCLERQANGTRRKHRPSFREYDSAGMCRDCRQYWFAENAAQDVWETYCLAVRAEARAGA